MVCLTVQKENKMRLLFLLLLLFYAHIGFANEETDVSKGFVVTTTSGKISLPALSSDMNDRSIDEALQNSTIAIYDILRDIVSFSDERTNLRNELYLFNKKYEEELDALNRIITDHRNQVTQHQANLLSLQKDREEFASMPLSQQDETTKKSLNDRLLSTDKKTKEIETLDSEITAMKSKFKVSFLRLRDALDAKVLRWINGNSLKLKLAERQINEVFDYTIRLQNILRSRLPTKPKNERFAKIRLT